jgi:hypothetical protein
MPHVSKHSQVPRKGIHSQRDDMIEAPEALARDDLSGAFGGEENEGQGHHSQHSSKLKSRRTSKSRFRTPKI